MDLEAKAKQIAETLNNDFLGIDDDGDPFLFKQDAALIIATALRAVRNAALEEAVGVADGSVDGFALARRIRALKG